MNSSEIKELLKDVVAPIRAIERKTGIPTNVLQQSLKGHRELPKEWAIRLRTFVDKKEYVGLRRKKRLSDKKEQVFVKEKKEKTEKSVAVKEKVAKDDSWTNLSRTEQMKRLRS